MRKDLFHNRKGRGLLLASVIAFSALLLSANVVPTLLHYKWSTTLVTSMPLEEEAHHGREVAGKVQEEFISRDRTYCASLLMLRIRAAFRAGDERLPSDPVAPTLDRPPRYC